MTNQAAQTMPELPEPFQPEIFRAIARSNSDTAKTNALLNAAREIERLTAALSQTAGVEVVAYLIDGRVEQGLAFDKQAAEDMAFANAGTVVPLARADAISLPAGLPKGWYVERVTGDADLYVLRTPTGLEWIVEPHERLHVLLTALLAAAPAASGGEADPKSPEYEAGFKAGMKFSRDNFQLPTAASVSERLLALADEIDRQARECPTVDWRPNAHENARNLRAIEQALTQQRGECEASVSVKQKWPKRHQFPKPDEHGNETGSIGEHAYAEGWNACLDEAKRMSGVPMPLKGKKGVVVVEDTTPQPSADAVRELVKRILNWQPLTSINKADRLYQILIAAGIPFESVTDELESLLSGGSHA
jgi:hypothetical protein